MEMRARIIVDGFMQGLHRSPLHGTSVEFAEYREYVPGDDTRFLDWKLYARSDRYCIKKFHADTNLSAQVLVDLSGSMFYGTTGYTKADYAKTLAATFSQFLLSQGDAVGLVTFSDQVKEVVPSLRKRGQMHSIVVGLEKSPSSADENSTDIRKSLREIVPLLKRRGVAVLFSDLLAPAEDIKSQLSYLRSCGHDVVVFNILDPAEIDFPFENLSRFEDIETGNRIYLDPRTAKETYQKRFTAHFEDIEKFCKSLGIDFYQISTADPFDVPLRNLLSERMRLRIVRRRNG
ncbi:MAG: DUF58 domain-containing protein [Verrucomicrobiae bacterium]|nr:DUF58 domain-containing protein [Verrucomicrobiae bacterium]